VAGWGSWGKGTNAFGSSLGFGTGNVQYCTGNLTLELKQSTVPALLTRLANPSNEPLLFPFLLI